MNNNSLKINQNKDGTFTVEWDKQDPEWSWMNNLTSKEIQGIMEKAIHLDQKNIKEVQVQFLDENPAWIPYDTLLSMLQVDINEDYTEWKDL